MQPTRIGAPRRPTRNKITKPGKSGPGKLWSTLKTLISIPSRCTGTL